MPALIRVAGAVTGRLLGPAGRLAAGNAVRNPRRTAATTASLLVGVTLTTAVLTGLASSRSAVADDMDVSHPVDVVAHLDRRPAARRRCCATSGAVRGVADAVAARRGHRPGRSAASASSSWSRPATSPTAVHGDPAVAAPRPGEIHVPWDLLAGRLAAVAHGHGRRPVGAAAGRRRRGLGQRRRRRAGHAGGAHRRTRRRGRSGCARSTAPTPRTSAATWTRWPSTPAPSSSNGLGRAGLGRPPARRPHRVRGRPARHRGGDRAGRDRQHARAVGARAGPRERAAARARADPSSAAPDAGGRGACCSRSSPPCSAR